MVTLTRVWRYTKKDNKQRDIHQPSFPGQRAPVTPPVAPRCKPISRFVNHASSPSGRLWPYAVYSVQDSILAIQKVHPLSRQVASSKVEQNISTPYSCERNASNASGRLFKGLARAYWSDGAETSIKPTLVSTSNSPSARSSIRKAIPA